MTQSFYLESLGCPKNDVDSDKIIGTLLLDGLVRTDDVGLADLVVVNTCAFIEDARRTHLISFLRSKKVASQNLVRFYESPKSTGVQICQTPA